MKALRKGVLYAVGLIVSLALLALLGVNLYLRSPGVRDEVAEALRARYGVTLSYGSLSYLPGRGLKVRRLTVEHRPEIAAITQVPFLEVEAIVAKVPFWSLVDRPVQVEEVRVIAPVVTTLQWLDGSIALPWVTAGSRPAPPSAVRPGAEVPTPEPGTPAADAGGAEVAGGNTRTGSAADSWVGPLPEEVTRPAAPPPGWRPLILAQLRVDKGAFHLLSPGGNRTLLQMTGFDGRMEVPSYPQGAAAALGRTLGEMSVERTDVLGALRVKGLRSKVQLRNDGTLALPELAGGSDGGTVTGSVIVDPRLQGLPFQVEMNCQGVALAPMSRRAAPRMMFARGRLEGGIRVEGLMSAAPSWRGQGNLRVEGAAMARNGLLESFGRYVGLREFVELTFQEARAVFEVRGPVFWFEDLHWKTENLEFKGLGAVGMNQRVKLAARLYFSRRVQEVLQRIERQLPERVLREPAQLEGRQDFYRDFVIAGPVTGLRANFVGSQGRTFEEMLELLRVGGAEQEALERKL